MGDDKNAYKERIMIELSEETMMAIDGGNQIIACFFMGGIFGAAIATGNILAAAGAGVYIATSCF